MLLKRATAKEEMMIEAREVVVVTEVKEAEVQIVMAEMTAKEVIAVGEKIVMIAKNVHQAPMTAIALGRRKENLEDKKQNLINRVIIS